MTYIHNTLTHRHQQQENLNKFKSTRNKDGGPHCNTTLKEHASKIHSNRTSNMGDHITTSNMGDHIKSNRENNCPCNIQQKRKYTNLNTCFTCNHLRQSFPRENHR
ncbi:hypothetical protein V8G54_010237 [Vigna mungo]|uniref:Uncharacterized protein n=1 Tax=Vigna mungo TaxID=3915 RepID=A0AAQ3NWP0_VIGMU